MKNTHLLIVSRSLPFHIVGGMEMVTWDLARQFVRDGLCVTVLTTEIPGKPEEHIVEGVNVIALKGTRPGHYSRAWWKKSRKYFDANLANKVSIVFSVSAAGFSLVQSKKYPKQTPFILQAHGTSVGEIKSKWKTHSLKAILASFHNIYWLFKDMYYYSKFRQVVAISEIVLNDLKQFPISCVLPKNKIHLISNGINPELFFPDEQQRNQVRQSLVLNADAKIVISISRLHPQKGVKYSLLAFAEYEKHNPNVYFLILGDGPEHLMLESLARELKIEQKVLFLGAIKREQLNQYLSAADIFLFMTTRSEGLPLNMLEALAAGLPIIISKHLGSALNVKEGISLADPTDTKVVANLIEQVLAKTNPKKESLLPSSFTLQACAEKYYKLFQSLN